jgi:hypothetical protein
MQVPTYAKYFRDILNKKKPLSTTEIIKLTKECSAAILNTSLIKKKDPGCPTIEFSIGNQYFNNALCDLGATVSVMPNVVFNKLKHPTLVPTSMSPIGRSISSLPIRNRRECFTENPRVLGAS